MANLKQFSRQVVEIMPLMLREFIKREDNELVRGRISFPQMVALHYVSQRRKATMSELAKVLATQLSSTTVLVDRLVRGKMLERQQDAKDRRIVWVALTPRGRRVIRKIMTEKRKSIRHIFAVLNEKERRQYLSALLKVKRHLTSLVVLGAVFFAPCFAQAEDPPLTLQTAYELSLKQSEVVAQQVQQLESAYGDFYSSLQIILPDVHYVITYFEQDSPRKGEEGSSASGDTASAGALRRTTPGAKFTFSQPLFSGFKELAALSGGGALKQQRRHEIRRAKEMLFVDVVDAFYQTLWKQKTVEIDAAIEGSIAERMRELEERVKLGRSRDGEMQTAKSDLKTVEASLQKAKREYVVARELLEFYVGRPIQGPLADEETASLQLGDLLRFLEVRDKRADVLVAKENLKVYQAKTISAQAGFLPTASLDGNYYTRRVGFQSGTDWDVLLTVDVPVFDGMETFGAVKKAYAEREIARLEYERVRRKADLEIKNFFETYRSMENEDKALEEAAEAAKENYAIQSQDYRMNLVNNLEVLDALRRSEEAQNGWTETHFEMKKSYWKFKVAVGEAP